MKSNMSYDSNVHHRRSIRLKEYDYSQYGYYFVTFCVQNHMEYFGVIENGQMVLNQYGKIVEKCWNELPNHYGNCGLDEYIIMPNHFHGILILDENPNGQCRGGVTPPLQNQTLGQTVGFFKYRTTKLINEICNTPGKQLWQRNYYEHIIRNENELFNIRRYIQNNPLEWYLDQNVVNNLW